MNEALENYWECIKKDIEEVLGFSNLKEWSKARKDFERFGVYMIERLRSRCNENPNLLPKCFKEGGKDEGFSNENLYRMLRLQYNSGILHIERFAILFGYDSCVEYCLAKEIEAPLPSLQNEYAILQQRQTNLVGRVELLNDQDHATIRSFKRQYQVHEIFIDPTFRNDDTRETHNYPLRLLENQGTTLIHSDSFTGKTTLLKFLATQKDNQLKLLIPLHRYTGDLIELIRTTYSISETEWAIIGRSPRLLLLLDAFDEIRNETLRKQLYKELQRHPRFILTTRSRFITDYTDIAQSSFEVIDYADEDIRLLSDRLLIDVGSKLRFYDGFRASKLNQDKNQLLKYPWIIVFVIEYFRDDQELDDNFFSILPTEVLDALISRLTKERSYKKDEAEKMCLALGKVIFDLSLTQRELPREIKDAELGEEEQQIIDDLATLGVVTVESTIAKRRDFRLNIPLLAETLIAFYIASLPEDKLSYILKKVYFIPVFHRALGCSILLRCRVGSAIDLYFDNISTDLVADGAHDQKNGYYHHLLQLYFFGFLPSGFLKNCAANYQPSRRIEDAYNPPIFEKIMGFILGLPTYLTTYNETQERVSEFAVSKRIAKKYEADAIRKFIEVRLFHAPRIVAKFRFLGDELWYFLKEVYNYCLEPVSDIPLGLLKILEPVVTTQGFFEAFRNLLTDEKKAYKNYDLMWIILTSPYQGGELREWLFHNFQEFQSDWLINRELNKERENWEDHMLMFASLLLYMKDKMLEEREFFELLTLLNGYDLTIMEDEVWQSYIGKFSSTAVTNLITKYFLQESIDGSFSTSSDAIYTVFSQVMLFSTKSADLIEKMFEIWNYFHGKLLKIQEQQLREGKEAARKQALLLNENIHRFFYQLTQNKPYLPIKENIENFVEVAIRSMYDDLRILRQDILFSAVFGNLVLLESERLLDFLKECDLLAEQFVLVFSREKLHYFTYATVDQNIRINPSYLAKVAKVCLEQCPSSFQEDIRCMTKNFQGLHRYSASHLSETAAFFQRIDQSFDAGNLHEINKAVDDPRFEAYALSRKHSKKPNLIHYVFLHAIRFTKPLFVTRKDDKTYDFEFSA